MKRILLVLTLGAALSSTAFAQPDTTSNTPPPGPPPGEGFHHGHGMDFLTDAEKAELKKAHDAAIAANPALGTEEQTTMEQMKAGHESGTPPTDAEKEQMHAFRDKMDAAMIAADPDVAPIIAKIKAHHHDHKGGGPGGPGGTPPAPSTSTTPPSGT